MSEVVPNALHAELRALIASSRQRLAGAVNAELTRLYWAVSPAPRPTMPASGPFGGHLAGEKAPMMMRCICRPPVLLKHGPPQHRNFMRITSVDLRSTVE